MNPVFTIGHSSHSLEAFLALLARHGVTALGDVRSQPYSRRFPHFCADPLRQALKAAGLAYVFLGKELGARSDDPACLVEGQVDYELLARTGRFVQGIQRVREGAGAHRVALMCAEREPLDCHRALLVARRLHADGLEVRHILADGGLEAHAESETRLRAMMGLPVADFFSDAAETLAAAYRLRARKLAFQCSSTSDAEESA